MSIIVKQMSRKDIVAYLPVGFTIIIAVCLSMLANWEMGGESWGYWYFARVFAETGRFVVPDRSPLYILYLNLFTWMPYPASVTAEYLVTTTITALALVAFFRPYLGIWLALFAACLWVPFIQMSEPPVQKLALACSLVAVLLREDKSGRFRLAASYAFLILAYYFRQTYLLMVVTFLAYDALQTLRESGIRSWFTWRPQFASDWPIFLVGVLLFWFLLYQSPLPWNNVQFTNTEWFPGDVKSMTGGALQAFNWRYIEFKYGTFAGHDWFFTNREAFGSATSITGMLVANPHLFLKILITNMKELVPDMMWGIPKIGIIFIDYLFKLFLLGGIIYGAFRASRGIPTKVLIVSSLFLVGVVVLNIPKSRYMFPMIPVYIMAASWYGTIIKDFLKKLYPSSEILFQRMAIAVFAVGTVSLLFYLIMDSSINHLKTSIFLAVTIIAFVCAAVLLIAARSAKTRAMMAMNRLVLALPTILMIVLFSAGTIYLWINILHTTTYDVRNGRLHILENRKASLKAAYPTLAPVFKGCRGVMSLEPTFFGAFLDIPQSKVFAVWEIPPFGKLGDAAYNGLTPDRVDCVFVSTNLANNIGSATNHQIRYQNYIKPYVDQLKTLGAVTYDLPYGQAVVRRK